MNDEQLSRWEIFKIYFWQTIAFCLPHSLLYQAVVRAWAIAAKDVECATEVTCAQALTALDGLSTTSFESWIDVENKLPPPEKQGITAWVEVWPPFHDSRDRYGYYDYTRCVWTGVAWTDEDPDSFVSRWRPTKHV